MASSALMGIQEQRIDGHTRPVLILPHPLGPNEDNHINPARNKLWNPKWLATNGSKDDYNKQFLQAVVNTTIANAKVCHPKRSHQAGKEVLTCLFLRCLVLLGLFLTQIAPMRRS